MSERKFVGWFYSSTLMDLPVRISIEYMRYIWSNSESIFAIYGNIKVNKQHHSCLSSLSDFPGGYFIFLQNVISITG